MYIDGVILFSLLMIFLILVMMGYIGIYFFRHIKIDAKKAEEGRKQSAKSKIGQAADVKVAA